MEQTCLCRTCKSAEREDGEVRCRPCHRKFKAWLHGDAFYQPAYDGVLSAPEKPEAEDLVSRALRSRFGKALEGKANYDR